MKRTLSLILAVILIFSFTLPSFAASDKATSAANDLYHKGLFQGKGTDETGKPIYALEDGLNRYEGVTMMVRLLGKEAEAKAGNWETPFPDVVDWAKPYIGYAYANGLTDGTTDTTFSPNEPATAQMFVTFALRALGYDKDAAWENWETLAAEANIIPEGVNLADFKRGDAVLVSAAALSAHVTEAYCMNCGTSYDGSAAACTECGYEQDSTLCGQLMANGVFNELAYSIYRYTLGNEVTAESPLMDIYGKLYANLEEGPYLGALWPMPFDSESAGWIIGAEGLDIVEAYACEPMMSSVALSVCLIKLAEGSDVEVAKTAIRENVNPAKWICVSVDPENIRVESIGNLVLLVMDNDNCQQIADAFLELAK